MLATWHFHIEVSSKCTLRCPRCPRQENPETLTNTELDLAFIKRNFTPEFVLNNVDCITFCGDDGDPIYAHDFIAIVQYLKSIKPVQLKIVTNGSHKKVNWWTELAKSLDYNDNISFSIDGYDNNSNNQYRVNSDWDSIMAGVKAFRANSNCKMTWAAIGFKFNEQQLDAMRKQAIELGFDVFQLTRSTKFGSVYPTVYGINDPLEPSVNFVSSSHRFERQYTQLKENRNIIDPINTKNLELYNAIDKSPAVIPLCEIGNKGLFIDSRGRFFPCCWVATRYGHNTEWQNLAESFNLHQRTLTDVLNDSFWENEFKAFKWQECNQKCNKNIVNKEYATS